MSMAMLTVIRIIWVLAAYIGVTLFLPWIILRKKLAGIGSVSTKFMAYFMIGNFYIMNLVFLLQLLHISCRLTLVIGTALPFVFAAYKYKDSVFPVLEKAIERIRLIAGGEIGKKTLILKFERKLRGLSSGTVGKWMSSHWPDIVLTLGIVLLIFYMYGTNAVKVYGYCASDMVVHHYWLSEMIHNNIFVDGVYPFGMHCVLYYLNGVFGIPGHVLFRIFGIVQTLMIHLMLLAFLRALCKSKYAPYAGLVVYLLSDRYFKYTYYRYYATLPQEFGMLFILPAVYFVIAFLKEKDFVLTEKKKTVCSRTAGLYLILFAVSVSMTLAVHFYGTIITGLFCIGIGAGFCFRCFRWRYFKRLMVAGIAGICIAVLPMAAAYVTGTPLQPSLNWGMSVLSGSTETMPADQEQEERDGEHLSAASDNEEQPVKGKSLTARMKGLYYKILRELNYYVVSYDARMPRFLLGSIGLLFLLGILWCILRRSEYGAVLMSASVFMLLMTVLQSAGGLGLPQVIEMSRLAVYYAYGSVLLVSLCLDAVLFLLFQGNRAMDLGSLGALGAVCVATGLLGIRVPVCLTAYETNGAMLCLQNIIHENRNAGNWTICSANDERWMVDEYSNGYHYETITFLRQMEETDSFASVTIPSSNVYFFIEKKPGLYMDRMNTEKPDKTVSPEGLRESLSRQPGIQPYIGDARWVTMSHMYYWAQEFKRLYPNEMEVYYEDDAFVCYRVRQNEYSLYNFAVDYGYAGETQKD